MRLIRQKLTLILPLTAALTLMPMHANAFDPTGFLVNKVMEFIIDELTKPKKPVYETGHLVSNRSIPETSKPGTMEPPANGNQLEINGDNYTLAFNSRIRDEGNRIVQTSMIVEEKRIRYTLNTMEQVDKIWLLTPDER